MPLKEESDANETSPLHPDYISSCCDFRMPSASWQQGQRFEKCPEVKRTQFLWIISVSLFLKKKHASLLFFQQLEAGVKEKYSARQQK